MRSLTKKIKHISSLIGVSLLLSVSGAADTGVERLNESASVLSEIMQAPDKGIPRELLSQAYCVAIVPGVKKAAFLVGAKYGKGFVVCRRATNASWGGPAAVRMEGGSFGFQIGAAETDVVLIIMHKEGLSPLLQDKFTLGGDISVAGGPVGRSSTAQTDAQMKAKILSYSRSRGAFAGISLEGATLRQDLDENKAIYGKALDNREILTTGVRSPKSASELIGVLTKFSHRSKRAAGK